jgi:hypothetical protein
MITHCLRRLRSMSALPLFVAAMCGSLHAQGLGSIVGTVSDPSGAVLPGATVKISDEGTSFSREVVSNSQGYYVFPSIRPSSYSLTVEARGFSPYVNKGVLLQADQTVTLNVVMSLGRANEQITIEGAPPQVDTSTSTLSEVVDRRRIVDLPLNGRNAASLALITVGTVLAPGSADEGNTKTFPVAVTVSANGSRQNQTSFRLDGANNNDIYTNVNQPFPFPDALQEFSVQTSNYSARYGGNAGGVVNIVTKSGVNEVHGGLFAFDRNAVFNARNFFVAKRDQLKRNQFGGTFGGPVTIPKLYEGKNKTFFFVGYQGTRIRNSGGGLSAYFPTADNLAGNFSNVSTQIYDPATCGTANKLSTCSPFAGNQIPVSRFDAAAVSLTKYLPVGVGSGQIFYSLPVANTFDETIVRIDQNLGQNDRLTARYFYDRYDNSPFLNLKNYVANSPFAVIVSHNIMLNETHTFGPGLVNDFHISAARETSNRGPAEGSINAADLGVNMYVPPGDKILESVGVTGYFTVSQTDPAAFIRNQYNLSDMVAWVHGSHSVSFGVDVNRAWVLLRNQFYQPGQFSFTADATGNALASYMLGKIRTFRQGNGEYKDNRTNSFGLFIQDDWHVTRRLMLNIGLRYDPFFPWKETKGRIELFKPDEYAKGTKSIMFTNAPKGLLFPGDPGVPKYGIKSAMKNFAPRVGFAYDLKGDGKTSIRGGLGVFYDSQQNGIYNNRFVDVSPFSTQMNFTDPAGPFSDPYRGTTNPFPAPYPPPKDIAFQVPNLAATYDPANGSVYQTPVVYTWNLALERQLLSNWLLRVAYVGSHSSHLLETLELSPTVYGTGGTRYFPEYSQIAAASHDVNSSYHSLQVTAQKRMSSGLTMLINYTWMKSIDTLPFGQNNTTVVSSNLSPIPWYMPGRHQFDRGPSEFDHKQRLVTSFVWDMPKLAHAPLALRTVAGGWQFTGLLSAQTGGPVTVSYGKDASGTALGSDRAVQLSGNVYGSGACGTKVNCVDYLNVAAFGAPAAGTFGNMGKGALRGPNMITYDGGLFKEFHLHGERVRLQFRAEFFNLLNRVNFYNPGGSVSTSSNVQSNSASSAAVLSNNGFGSLTAAFDPRIGQLGLKIVF